MKWMRWARNFLRGEWEKPPDVEQLEAELEESRREAAEAERVRALRATERLLRRRSRWENTE